MKLGILHSRVRKEEKMIFQAAEAMGVEVVSINDEKLILDARENRLPAIDLALDRCLAHLRAEITLRMIENLGVRTVNTYQAAVNCDNKIMTDILMARAGIPAPRTLVAYTVESALQAIEEIGYPVVMKPFMGSWGRLLAKVNDREAAEALLEHKETLGSMHHSVFYMQEYIRKPERDIRAFVIKDRVIAAMYRNSEHWITNTAKGGFPLKCEITPEIESLAVRAAQCVGVEIAGVDILESPDGLKVIEINVGAEFHGLNEVADVNIAREIIAYCLSLK